MHDKRLANEMELVFLTEHSWLLNLGFLGYQPKGAKTILPFKKPYQGELSEYDKL